MFLTQQMDGRKIRDFTLSNTFIDQYKGLQPPWGQVGYFTYKRTYARTLPDGSTEEYWQTCKRVVEGVYNIQKQHCKSLRVPWNDRKAQNSAQEMFVRMWKFKFTPPGRGLWTMGTDLIYQKGSAALNNCAFVTTKNIDVDFATPFCFLMDMSMFGVGVGGDCRGAGKIKLQPPLTSQETFIVEDSREGWVDLIRVVLNSYVGKNPMPANIDYSEVRPKGTPIKGFGGIASGPEPLMLLVKNIKTLLDPTAKAQTFISSTQIVDLFNHIGVCVVSGGVRRTAEIMFGEPTDSSFMNLKNPEALLDLIEKQDNCLADSPEHSFLQNQIDSHPLRTHRWASNNSIFGKIGMDYTEIADGIKSNGEPGIIWLDNIIAYGRMADDKNYKDFRVIGTNPCSEQSLEDHELCCLVETFPAHHSSFEDYQRTLKFAYLYAKTVTLVPTHNLKTNAVMMRNRRIGCSMSGIVQAMNKLGRQEFIRWCNNGYEYINRLDTIYSEWLCVPHSIKMTSVKPSGTVSLLCGATPGIHYPESEYYIRNIRVSDTSPLVKACQEAGFKVSEDVYSPDTYVISFPVKEKYFQKGKRDVSIWEQFLNAVMMQAHWADNQVSCTITFQPHEQNDIKECLEIFQNNLKSISLLPLEEHGYINAPYEPITEAEYLALTENLKELDLSTSRHEVEDKFCDGDSCSLEEEIFNN